MYKGYEILILKKEQKLVFDLMAFFPHPSFVNIFVLYKKIKSFTLLYILSLVMYKAIRNTKICTKEEFSIMFSHLKVVLSLKPYIRFNLEKIDKMKDFS